MGMIIRDWEQGDIDGVLKKWYQNQNKTTQQTLKRYIH
jgi:hypothetical protein